jgi:hypothetical protein
MRELIMCISVQTRIIKRYRGQCKFVIVVGNGPTCLAVADVP